MNALREYRSLQAELAGLKSLLQTAPPHKLATPMLRNRIAAIEKSILVIDASSSEIPQTELFFKGGAAVDSQGLELRFASKILTDYQKTVTEHYAAKYQEGYTGAAFPTAADETKLYLTELPRGSFGLQLTWLESASTDRDEIRGDEQAELIPTQSVEGDIPSTSAQVATVMAEITEVLRNVAAPTTSQADPFASLSPPVLAALDRFLHTVWETGGSLRMVTGLAETELNHHQIDDALHRLFSLARQKKVAEETAVLEGIFGGVLLDAWEFNFRPAQARAIRGRIRTDLPRAEAAMLNHRFTDKRVAAKIKVTTTTWPNGDKRKAYELLDIKPLDSQELQIDGPAGSPPPPKSPVTPAKPYSRKIILD